MSTKSNGKIYVDSPYEQQSYTKVNEEKLVFNIEIVKDLVFKYLIILCSILIWMHGSDVHLYTFMFFWALELRDVRLKVIKTQHPLNVVDTNTAKALLNIWKTYLDHYMILKFR